MKTKEPVKNADCILTILKAIPLARRRELRKQILPVLEDYGLPDDIMKDQRTGVAWLKGAKSWKAKREGLDRYFISVRGIEMEFTATLVEAARFMGVTENSIRQRVTSTKPYSKAMEIGPKHGYPTWVDDIVECRKLTESEQEEALKRYYDGHENKQNTPL
jgi:hypothetical protein